MVSVLGGPYKSANFEGQRSIYMECIYFGAGLKLRRVVRVLGEAPEEGDLFQADGAYVLAVSDPEPVVGHHLRRVAQVTHDPVVKSVLPFVRVNLGHVWYV